MEQGQSQPGEIPVQLWEPHRYLRTINRMHSRFSKGFLVCRPERWFPGFAAQWLPLAHSLGVDFKVIEVKPSLILPPGMSYCYSATIDSEPAAVLIDDASAEVLLDAFIPGAKEAGHRVLMEYLARRYLGSLALAWSGPESSSVEFISSEELDQRNTVGAIKLLITINNSPCSVWMALGRQLVERLDGLWRRQLRSTSKRTEGEEEVSLEIAQLAIPPASLVEYLKPGTIIDLETPVQDLCVMRTTEGPWLSAKMVNIEGQFGFEVLPGSPAVRSQPDGTTRLSVQIGSIRVGASTLPEIAQIGAILESEIPLGSQARLIINSEKVAEASLCVFEGRFALSVK